ncbi:MAG: diaminopimelate epimerase [Myxococcales bacterium]|jgi:diaminopimelate epimerase|nr:diaminopimelate epimerase [Myxococcales bacterium]
MQLRFAKYEGLGNDFIVVAAHDEAASAIDAETARLLCDRHKGVGADGVLLVGVRDVLSMHVINADGSVPEMCGNGLRVAALFAAEAQGRDRLDADFETGAGPHTVSVARTARTAWVDVGMRVPSLVPAEIPVAVDAPLVDADFEVDGMMLRVTAVSMGNPHLVTFENVGERRRTLGPRLERDPRFPAGVNVGFGAFEGDELVLHVWERGAGWTLACGTGACAAAVAAVETGRAKRGEPIAVRLPGGKLTIRVGEPHERVRMGGPARHVFDGVVDLEALRSSA